MQTIIRYAQPFRSLALLCAVAIGAACGGESVATGPDPKDAQLVVAEMVVVDGAGNLMYSHRDHWHGFPVVPANGHLSLESHFVARASAADDHDAPPQSVWFTLATYPDVDVRVVVSDTTVARWSGDKVRGTLTGQRPGASMISFVVRRGATTLKELPPLNFVVR